MFFSIKSCNTKLLCYTSCFYQKVLMFNEEPFFQFWGWCNLEVAKACWCLILFMMSLLLSANENYAQSFHADFKSYEQIMRWALKIWPFHLATTTLISMLHLGWLMNKVLILYDGRHANSWVLITTMTFVVFPMMHGA
jgi:hypothetical protein